MPKFAGRSKDAGKQTDAFAINLSRKPPRRYALDYIASGADKDKQREAVKGAPKEWQDLIRTHIKLLRERQCLKSQ